MVWSSPYGPNLNLGCVHLQFHFFKLAKSNYGSKKLLVYKTGYKINKTQDTAATSEEVTNTRLDNSPMKYKSYKHR